MPARMHKTPAHAKRALLWTAGVYVAAQLTFSLLLDYRWPFMRFPSARVRLDQLAKSQIKPDIVLLGSSRFEAGIIPAEIAWQLDRQCLLDHPVGVFKGGISCGDPIVFEFIFNRLLEAGFRPKLLVLEISPETLNRNNQWLGMHVRRQLRWDDVPRYFLDICRSDQSMRWLGERINPIFIHREELWHNAAGVVEQSSDQSAAGLASWAIASTKPGNAFGGDACRLAIRCFPQRRYCLRNSQPLASVALSSTEMAAALSHKREQLVPMPSNACAQVPRTRNRGSAGRRPGDPASSGDVYRGHR